MSRVLKDVPTQLVEKLLVAKQLLVDSGYERVGKKAYQIDTMVLRTVITELQEIVREVEFR